MPSEKHTIRWMFIGLARECTLREFVSLLPLALWAATMLTFKRLQDAF